MGRPSDFTQELAAEICALIANGASLRMICESNRDYPSARTVHRWLADNETFRQQYAQARSEQADHYAEQAVDEALAATDAAIGRLRMDALKWAAGKLAPKRWGDKVQLDANVTAEITEVRRTIVRPDP